MNSRVHPKYKTKYRVSNWAEYDRALVERGHEIETTLWVLNTGTPRSHCAFPYGHSISQR